MPIEQDIEAGVSAVGANSRHLDLPRLTRQETEFAAVMAATSNDLHLAAQRAGVPIQTAGKWARRADIQQHIDALLAPHREQLAKGVSYTLADAHADIEMGKRMAANAGEWFKGVELQMRLHGLGDKKVAEVNVNINSVTSRTQLERLDDEQLLQMAGFSLEDLLPQAVDAEFVDVQAEVPAD